MPIINIEYDEGKVTDSQINELSVAVQAIVSKATNIEDVFVYANSAHIRLKIAPIEVFVRMSESKVVDLDALFAEIKQKIKEWKGSSGFDVPVNLTVIPMHWKFDTGI